MGKQVKLQFYYQILISVLKNVIKKIFPIGLIAFCNRKYVNRKIKIAYSYDLKRYIKHSRTNGDDTSEKLAGEIITLYHVIEKGLTMPEPRMGFGQERIIQLCEACQTFINQYGLENNQVVHAIQVILEYEEYHIKRNHQLNSAIIGSIHRIKSRTRGLSPSHQQETTRQNYFQKRLDQFDLFSNSRSSIRNFGSENVSTEKLLNVLELIRNTPSACNRQSWRTYVFSDKKQILELLEIQGGNRGFGHLTNKLIIITGELGVFNGIAERNQVFIDGGMYAMNLLYSLHFHEIGACILNCSHVPQKDIELRKVSRINESEVLIAMIACGIPPDSFMIAKSERYGLDKINTMVG